MSLKILFDPIYSGQLTGCSTAFKCKTLVETALHRNKRDDFFFYWMVPPNLSEEEQAWLPQHPNVTYIEFPYLKDRMREYMMFRAELDEVLAFNGTHWDFDVLFTSRTALVPLSRAVMSSPRQKGLGHKLKKIMVFEEMIVLDTRPTVAKSDVPAQELMTLSGYLASDVTYLVTEKEQREIVETARRYLAPSKVIEMISRFQRISQLDTGPARLKEEKFRFRKGERPLCITYSGRMERSGANLADVFEIMDKHWILKGDVSIKTLICTVSKATMLPPPEHTEVRHASRAEFWRAAKEEMDVMLVLHRDAEFSLSMVEPMVFGVPVIVIDQDWSRSVWGNEYPFYASGFTEAYGLVKAFHDDYEAMYAEIRRLADDAFRQALRTGRRPVGQPLRQGVRVPDRPRGLAGRRRLRQGLREPQEQRELQDLRRQGGREGRVRLQGADRGARQGRRVRHPAAEGAAGRPRQAAHRVLDAVQRVAADAEAFLRV